MTSYITESGFEVIMEMEWISILESDDHDSEIISVRDVKLIISCIWSVLSHSLNLEKFYYMNSNIYLDFESNIRLFNQGLLYALPRVERKYSPSPGGTHIGGYEIANLVMKTINEINSKL